QEPGGAGTRGCADALPTIGNSAAVCPRQVGGHRWERGGTGTASGLLLGAGRGGGPEIEGCGAGRVAAASRRGAREPARRARLERRGGRNRRRSTALRGAATVLGDAGTSHGGATVVHARPRQGGSR